MYYTDFDLRPEHELEEIFDFDAVPAVLNFQDLDESDWLTESPSSVFQEWLTEGRHNCDVAQALLHTWTHHLQGSASDTLKDFFDQLFQEYAETRFAETPPDPALPLRFLAEFVLEHCSLAATLHATTDDDKAHEIIELITKEVAVVQAYTTAWRGTGTVEAAAPQNVRERTQE